MGSMKGSRQEELGVGAKIRLKYYTVLLEASNLMERIKARGQQPGEDVEKDSRKSRDAPEKDIEKIKEKGRELEVRSNTISAKKRYADLYLEPLPPGSSRSPKISSSEELVPVKQKERRRRSNRTSKKEEEGGDKGKEANAIGAASVGNASKAQIGAGVEVDTLKTATEDEMKASNGSIAIIQPDSIQKLKKKSTTTKKKTGNVRAHSRSPHSERLAPPPPPISPPPKDTSTKVKIIEPTTDEDEPSSSLDLLQKKELAREEEERRKRAKWIKKQKKLLKSQRHKAQVQSTLVEFKNRLVALTHRRRDPSSIPPNVPKKFMMGVKFIAPGIRTLSQRRRESDGESGEKVETERKPNNLEKFFNFAASLRSKKKEKAQAQLLRLQAHQQHQAQETSSRYPPQNHPNSSVQQRPYRRTFSNEIVEKAYHKPKDTEFEGRGTTFQYANDGYSNHLASRRTAPPAPTRVLLDAPHSELLYTPTTSLTAGYAHLLSKNLFPRRSSYL